MQQVQAKDLDEVDKGKIVYSILHISNNGREKFRISSETGKIEVISKIYAGEQYSLTIQASDSRNMRSQSILDIIVVPGQNAGGPVFPKDRYEIEVSEGVLPSTPVLNLKATDPENDAISYSIISGNVNEGFSIGQNSGTIWVSNSLDREEVSSYSLVIRALDRGGLSGTTTVNILITDVNDENPQFLQESYEFKVDEGTPNAFVGKVAARDPDLGENGEVAYDISDPISFSINPRTGEIYTRQPLDYEKQKIYQVVVTAKDLGQNSRLSTTSVSIHVLDVQDELPVFEKNSHEVTIPENAANTQVLKVEAIDPDSFPTITYVIKEGDQDLFEIDASSGVIKTKDSGLDYEKQTSHVLIIGTEENNSNDPKATASVKISVVDQNDNPPSFLNVPMPIRLQDSVPLGTIVATLVAYDADSTSPGNQVRYEIAGKGKSPSYFLIDSNTGVISVKDDLRKEPESEYRVSTTFM